MDEISSYGIRPTFLQVMTHLPGSYWPYSDSAAPEAVAGEKDACGVGFLAQLQGEASHWVLQQALRGLGCMEHRGGVAAMGTPAMVLVCSVRSPGPIYGRFGQKRPQRKVSA